VGNTIPRRRDNEMIVVEQFVRSEMTVEITAFQWVPVPCQSFRPSGSRPLFNRCSTRVFN
jgi:hypothetical protein